MTDMLNLDTHDSVSAGLRLSLLLTVLCNFEPTIVHEVTRKRTVISIFI